MWKNYAARLSSKNWIVVPESRQSENHYEMYQTCCLEVQALNQSATILFECSDLMVQKIVLYSPSGGKLPFTLWKKTFKVICKLPR